MCIQNYIYEGSIDTSVKPLFMHLLIIFSSFENQFWIYMVFKYPHICQIDLLLIATLIASHFFI